MRNASFHSIVLLCACALVLSSCHSRRFYEQLDGTGQIRGRPAIEWVQPDRFVYDPQKSPDFAFHRSNGEIITPGKLSTDGGSLPRPLWGAEGFSPWTYAPAYLIHDWLYEAHRRGKPAGKGPDGTSRHYTKKQSDWIMAEVIKSQMENEEEFKTEKSPSRLKKIHWAVTKFGQDAWDDKPTPIPSPVASTVGDALDALQVGKIFDALESELTAPSAPRSEGSATPQP